MSGKRNLDVIKNWSYGQNKLYIPNSKHTTIANKKNTEYVFQTKLFIKQHIRSYEWIYSLMYNCV